MHKQIVLLLLAMIGGIISGRAQSSYTDSLLHTLGSSVADTQRVRTLSELSRTYLATNPQATLRYAKQALALADSLSFSRGQVDAFLNIGRAYASLAKYERAIGFLTKARRIARSINYEPGIFEAFNAIGLCYGRMGDYDQAIRRIRHALTVAKRIGREDMEGTAYNNLGMVYFLQGNYVPSLKNYLAAIQIFEGNQDLPKMGRAYLNLGSMAAARDDLEEADDWYRKSLKLFEELDDRRLAAIAHYGIGEVATQLGNYTAAEQSFTRALEGARQFKDLLNQANTLNGLGHVAYFRDDFAKSQEYYEQALIIHRSADNQQGVAESLINISKIYNALQNYRKAIDLANQGLELAQSIQHPESARDAVLALHESYQALGQYEQSLAYFKTYTAYGDSIMDIQSAKEIQQLQFERTLEQQETENDLLKAQATWQGEQVAMQKKVRNFLILGCLLLAVVTFLLFRSRMKERETNAEMALQRDALEEANRSKNKLFSVISHDLRSPLNSLQGLFSLLQDGHLSSTELQVMLPELTQRLNQTHSLLDNLLIWAKSQMQGIKSHPAIIDLVPVIENTVGLIDSQAKHKHIRIVVETPRTLEAYADLDMVMIVLRNLLTNAVKFTTEQGTIRITGEQSPDVIRISIQDTGIGISEEAQQLLFIDDTESTAGTRGEKGTGLGLLLSKDFVEKNGGKIWVESEMKLGSTFTFTVPTNKDTSRKKDCTEEASLL